MRLYWFYFLICLSTFFLSIIGIILTPFDWKGKIWARIVKYWAMSILWIGNIPYKIIGLEKLDLASNNLQGDIPDLSSTNLNELNLGDNGMIDDLDLLVGIFSELTNLTKLNLSYNKITNLPKGIFDGLTNLQHINLINNSLETIHLSTKEFLKNNNIEVIL